MYGRKGNKEVFEQVYQIPEIRKTIRLDSGRYLVRKTTYKLDGKEVSLTDFVQAWIDYRRYKDHEDVDFMVEYKLHVSYAK